MRELLRPGLPLKPFLGAPLDRGHPLAASLKNGWLLNEGAGPRSADATGNTSLVLSGTGSWQPGMDGPAVSVTAGSYFGGATGAVTRPYTVVVWVYPTSSPVYAHVFGHSNLALSAGFILSVAGGHPEFNIMGAGGGEFFPSPLLSWTLGTWNMLALSISGTAGVVSVGNVATGQIVTGPVTVPTENAGANLLSLGCAAGTSSPLLGSMQAAYYFRDALTVPALRALMTDPYAMFRRSRWYDSTALITAGGRLPRSLWVQPSYSSPACDL